MSLGKGVLKSSLEHQTILGTRIDATSYQDACDRLQGWMVVF
jgi:N-acetylglucosaminyldiphosphoundecaprenol N-acetyl-beta-D-mannosaminyltransferase